MVIYLVENVVPAARAEDFSRWQATHVTKVVAAMGRNAFATRARVAGEGDTVRFLSIYELPSIGALEGFMMSREREELAGEIASAFPEAKVQRIFGERVGTPRRGERFGEEPGAAFVVQVEIPAADAEGWVTWYDEEHVPQVLADKGFVRARHFELHSEDAAVRKHLVIYDAVDRGAIDAFRQGPGPRLSDDHASRFPSARIERQSWEWLQ